MTTVAVAPRPGLLDQAHNLPRGRLELLDWNQLLSLCSDGKACIMAAEHHSIAWPEKSMAECAVRSRSGLGSRGGLNWFASEFFQVLR